MKWIDVKKDLPEVYEDVLVWVKFEDNEDFRWSDSCLDKEEVKSNFSYREPISKRFWQMGSARNYVITHWMRIDEPK